MTESDAVSMVASVNKTFHDLYRATQSYGDVDDDENEGELLCDVEFSLAYGGMFLFQQSFTNHLSLHQYRHDALEQY
jgi:hypothetical protein